MPIFDRKTFFTYARRAPFGNRLTQEQVEGMSALIEVWERYHGEGDIRWLAYILATAFHETGGRMVPVREGFAKTDAQARRIVAKYRYGKPDATSDGKPIGAATGHVYYGRGHVQLTWKDNYVRMTDLLGIDLVNDPDAALLPEVSAHILIEGMLRGVSKAGDFTGKSVESYFTDVVDDPVGARAVVNGTDKAKLIAGYHQNFLDSLEAAKTAADHSSRPADVSLASATPDGANLLTDKTMLGAVAAGGGGVAASLVGAINNPFALVFALVVAAGIFLVVTGRISLKREAGA